jgi:3-deoxy-D-manno-octulosonic-acid transferase
MNILYNFFIRLYGIAIRAASLFSPKARDWVTGRKDIFRKLDAAFAAEPARAGKTAWFHCASLGEFEQGRPVIEQFRAQYPNSRILLTFFSPSGYEIRKDYPGADFVCYLPLDTPSNVSRFLGIAKPALAFFIKYEYWYNYLEELDRRNIPVFMLSAIFRKNQHFFKPWGGWFRERLRRITWFFVQNGESGELLSGIGIKQFTVTGDTRFDRVSAISAEAGSFPEIEKFAGGSKVFVAGSTWPADESIILPLIRARKIPMKFIIAPHEVDQARIEKLVASIKHPVVRLSELNMKNAARARVIVIDSMGILSKMYRFADLAYIGGGFGAGIHNILEAAVYGKPVIFGPNYKRFTEAVDLVGLGGATPVKNGKELKKTVEKYFTDNVHITHAGETSALFVESNKGATRRILDAVRNYGFIPSGFSA